MMSPRRPDRQPDRGRRRPTFDFLECRLALTATVASVSNALISPNQASSAGVQDTTVITLANSGGKATNVSVRIRSGTGAAGTLVRSSANLGTINNNGTATFTWDGKDGTGAFVAEGTYTARVVQDGGSGQVEDPTGLTIVVDNTNPTIAPASPADGSLVGGTITLGATPLDAGNNDSNIAKVSFFIDGSSTAAGTDTSSAGGWTFALSTTSLTSGSHTWTAKAYDKAGNVGTSTSRTFVVDKTAPTVATNAVAGATFGAAVTITGTSSDAGSGVGSVQVVVKRSSDGTILASGSATNTGTSFSTWSFAYTPGEAGAQNVVATATDGVGNAANASAKSFTVAKSAQSLTFGPLSDVAFGTGSIALAATASSGLAPTYSVVSGPATVSGSTLTPTGAGTVVVRAAQAGNANYSAAASVDATFQVTKAAQTINFAAPAAHVYGDAPFALAATATSGLAVTYAIVSGPATVSGTTVTIIGAGTVVVRAAQAGDANYNAAASVDRPFSVARADQAITFDALANKTTDDAPFGLAAVATSGLAVTFSIDSGSATLAGNTLTIQGVGWVAVRASQAGGADYNAAADVVQSFYVAQGTKSVKPTIFVDAPLDSVEVGQEVTLVAHVGSGPNGQAPTGLVTFYENGQALGSAAPDIVGVARLSLTTLGVGSHAIVGAFAGDANLAANTSAPFTIAVSKAASSLAAGASPTVLAAGQPVTLTARVTPGSAAAPQAVGPVVFYDGGQPIGWALPSGGVARLTVVLIGVGKHPITAGFAGDASLLPSVAGGVVLAVNQGVTKTTLMVPSKANSDAAVTLVARVGPTKAGLGVPVGVVTFKDGNRVLAVVPLDANGQAAFTTSDLALGKHTIRAYFAESSSFKGSTSGAVSVNIVKPPAPKKSSPKR